MALQLKVHSSNLLHALELFWNTFYSILSFYIHSFSIKSAVVNKSLLNLDVNNDYQRRYRAGSSTLNCGSNKQRDKSFKLSFQNSTQKQWQRTPLTNHAGQPRQHSENVVLPGPKILNWQGHGLEDLWVQQRLSTLRLCEWTLHSQLLCRQYISHVVSTI